ncbi:SDR family NAD(P)-dependent oxidoreductase [Aquamicrobium segne]|uniref:SDR family NAD(P)-dependent oxidoreductase n=1 Tax=Aquamicrobium segne TaxID=469547 RepID=A0ABW0H202_9HYPH
MQKILILTGGASGIGRGILERAIATGWTCAVLDLPGDALDTLATSSPADLVMAFGVDITDQDAIESAIDEIAKKYGRIDALVNCAGIGQNVAFKDTTPEQFRKMLDVNVVGAFIVSQAAIRHMEGGAVVNITSVSGIQGSVGRVAYGTSKGAVNMMTRIMAVELAPASIRVNAIAPGPVDTPMAQKWHDQKTRNDWVSRVPLARYGTIDEIASMTMILLDNEVSSYVNGQVIAVDGGFTVSGLMAK